MYERLVNDWSTIFPDGNRNAAGPRFFKYILDQKLEYEEFIQFNKLYCAVSGSLIPPDIKNRRWMKDLKIEVLLLLKGMKVQVEHILLFR